VCPKPKKNKIEKDEKCNFQSVVKFVNRTGRYNTRVTFEWDARVAVDLAKLSGQAPEGPGLGYLQGSLAALSTFQGCCDIPPMDGSSRIRLSLDTGCHLVSANQSNPPSYADRNAAT
jgi:hypothetical protein